METNKWVEYLQDTRNDMANYLLAPIEKTLKDKDLSTEEKIQHINKAVEHLHEKMKGWDVKDYGISLP